MDAAIAHLEAALALHGNRGERYERARTLLVHGVALRRAKRKRAAREALREAELAFAELGATIWAGRARGELQRISGAAPHGGDLSETERRVAAPENAKPTKNATSAAVEARTRPTCRSKGSSAERAREPH